MAVTQWSPPVTIREVFPFPVVSLYAPVPVSQVKSCMKFQWPGSMRNENVLAWTRKLIGKKPKTQWIKSLVQEVCLRSDFVLCRRIMLLILKFHFPEMWMEVSSLGTHLKQNRNAGCACDLLGFLLLDRGLWWCPGRWAEAPAKSVSCRRPLACLSWCSFEFFPAADC